jgi:hypothetical protein
VGEANWPLISPRLDDLIVNLSSKIGNFPPISVDVLPALNPVQLRPVKATPKEAIPRPSSDTLRVILALTAVAMAIDPTRVAPGLAMDGGTVSVGGMGVAVGEMGVAVGGMAVAVGVMRVSVGGMVVAVTGTVVSVGGVMLDGLDIPHAVKKSTIPAPRRIDDIFFTSIFLLFLTRHSRPWLWFRSDGNAGGYFPVAVQLKVPSSQTIPPDMAAPRKMVIVPLAVVGELKRPVIFPTV